MKDNTTNIDSHSGEKEVKNMIENGVLENWKTCQTLDSIHAAFSNDSDTLRKELNLDS